MAEFWGGFAKILGVGQNDKVLIGRNTDGNVMYADAGQFYDYISNSYFANVKPTTLASGANLGSPSKLTTHYVHAGSYNTNSGTITITADLALLFWDLTAWTYVELLSFSELLRKDGFTAALQSEIDRTNVVTEVLGTTLTGTGFDNVELTRYRYNEPLSRATKTGVIKQIRAYFDSTGNVSFCIVQKNASSTTLIKNIGTFAVVAGLNTITIANEAITEGQYLAVGGITTSVKVAFGSIGLAGNVFVQGNASTNISGSAGSYYAYNYTLEYTVKKPLDDFRKILDSYSRGELYTRIESDAKYLEVGTKFTAALQSEIDRTNVVTEVLGTTLTGTGFDNVELTRYRYNEPLSRATKTGVIKQIKVYCDSTGNIAFCIVQKNASSTTLIKNIGNFAVTAGLNTITIANEAIVEGQYLAVGGITTSVKVGFGSSGATGNVFVQGNTSTNISGTAGSYYAFSYTLEYTIVNPLDIFRRIADSYAKTEVYNKTEADAKYLEAGVKFKSALEQEISTDVTVMHQQGTLLVGGSLDNIDNLIYRFNNPTSISGYNGTIKQLIVNVDSSGNIPLAIVTSNGTNVTVVAYLGLFAVVAGTNTIALNQPIRVGQILAIGGAFVSVKLKWGSGLTGNNFVQGRIAGNGSNANGGAGTYYSYQYSVEEILAKPTDIFTKKTEVYLKEAADSTFTKNVTKVIIRAKKNGTVGVDCEFNGNRAIQDAIDSITDASASKQYEVVVFDGHYKATQTSDYTAGGITTGMVSWIRGKNYVSVRGVGIDRVKISSTLPNNLTGTVYQFYQTVYWHSNFGSLSGLTVECSENRYPIHIDMGATIGKNFVSSLFNLRIVHKGNTGNAVAWASWHPIGLGMSDGQVLLVTDSITESPTNPFYVHNNSNFEKPSEVRFVRCRGVMLSTSNKVAGTIESLGSNQRDKIYLEGSNVSGCYILRHKDTPFIPQLQSQQYYNHADYQIQGVSSFPFVYDTELRGYCLLFESKTTGTSSTVRFDENSSAFPLIIRDRNYIAGNDSVDEFGENYLNGYDCRNGDTDISGYGNGRLDIGMDGVGLGADKYVKSLGKRLGDCSVTTKTLGVIVDGVAYNIVFDKNYIGAGTVDTVQSSYTNSTIIAEILAVVGGVCNVSEFSVGREYFPEFTDYVVSVRTSETILKGMAVYNDNGVIRRALSTDKRIFGVSLDNIVTGYQGRILTKGYIRSNQTYRFSTLQETYSAVVKGEELGISSTAGKLSKSATIKHFYCFADSILSFNL